MQKHRLFALAAVFTAIAASANAQSSGLAANAPSDRPIGPTADCQWHAIQKAIEPLVAQARQTYPAARRRFMDRAQPIRPMFVTIVLVDSAAHREQVFVRVDSFAETRILGRIASPVSLVKGFRYGQLIAVDEKQMMDWMFANPDGTEEGNVVGKFMDTYQPPRSCSEAAGRAGTSSDGR